jgi:pimeloyl-[acyl-carrier protein] synthase
MQRLLANGQCWIALRQEGNRAGIHPSVCYNHCATLIIKLQPLSALHFIVFTMQFNPFDPSFQNTLYATYAAIREQQPIYPADLGGWRFWLLTRHADVDAVLRDNRFGRGTSVKTAEQIRMEPEPYRAIVAMLNDWMILRDPPDHTRLRKLVNRAFTPRVIEGLRPRIQQIADELIERVAGRGSMDLIADYAFPLPIIVIAELLGIPADLFRRWSSVLVQNIDLNQSNLTAIEGSKVALELAAYLRTMIAERKRQPQADLISELIAAEEQGDKLSEDELIANCALLLAAGHETTVNLIGNGTLALLRNPGQLAMLRHEPALIPNAVEELLRYDSPVQMTFRDVLEDVELEGVPMRRGQQVCTAFGAANRDPAIFAAPDMLDITRKEASKHLAFAAGIHFCVGAALARAEGQIAIGTLARRLPTLHLQMAEPPLRETIVLRGRSSLPVGW